MEFRSSSKLLLGVLIVFLALEYTSAKRREGNGVTKRELLHSTTHMKHEAAKIFVGRKTLQVEGKNEPGDAFLEPSSDEVANLMARDYATVVPRRKSPIHNSQPND